jgi:nucleoside-diphosphate-sugar epimerase
MKKILIIGATGFVDGYLTRQLLAEGYSVRCMARNPDKVKGLADNGCEIVKGDLIKNYFPPLRCSRYSDGDIPITLVNSLEK